MTIVDHFSHCPAEILYCCPLRLPGEFFEPNNQSLSENTYVANLKMLMEQLTATSIRTRSLEKTYVSNALFSASHVFISEDGQCSPLQRSYRGLFEVKERSEKYFLIDINGKLCKIEANICTKDDLR